MGGSTTDLEKRLDEVLEDYFSIKESGYGVDELDDAIKALKQLFIEWAEGCVPEQAWPTHTDESRDHFNAGFNDCRTQTINNVKGDSNE